MPRQRINGGIIGPVNEYSKYYEAAGVWTLEDTKQGELNIIRDNYFNRTNLLIHADGSNNANNNVFIDSSTAPFNITRNGNPTQGTFSPFSPGWSMFFPGTAGIGLGLGTGSQFAYATGDFTIEMWYYPQFISGRVAGQTLYDARPPTTNGNYVTLRVADGGRLSYITTGGERITSDNAFILNQWHHVALCRSGTNTRIFVNGQQRGSTYTDTINYLVGTPFIGVDSFRNTDAILGPAYISNLRIVKGSALYTANFTVPSIPLTNVNNTVLLTLQNNRVVDNSSSPVSLTNIGDGTAMVPFSPSLPDRSYSSSSVGGSAYFDGTGDWLGATLTGAAPGTGDFTYECWAYISSFATNMILWTTRSGDTSDGFQVLVTSGGQIRVGFQTINFINSSAGLIKAGNWFHVAVTRSGTTMTLWVDGVSIGTSTRSENFNSTSFRIGVQADTLTNFMLGYISNMRVTIGTALYTSTFSVPTEPLPSVANTKLLLNFTNAAIIDNTAKNVIETVGDAAISSTQAKFGGTSLFFDGTGDRLTIPDSSHLRFRNENFTVECWVYPTGGSGSNRGIISKGGASTGWSLIATSANVWGFINTTTTTSSSTAVTLNAWTHLALVRNGSNIRLFVNGTLQATATSVTTDFSQTDPLYIGSGRAADIPFTGYIDEIRITRGVSRYISNFTPSTIPFLNL